MLEFSAEGRLSERRALKVRGEQRNDLSVNLIEPALASGAAADERRADKAPSASTPLYKRWWLWTSIGAVVAGGVAAGLILGLRPARVRDPDGGSTGDTVFIASQLRAR